jgi:hypothetical protein
MADLAQLDSKAKGGEVRLRALLEDLVQYHTGVYPRNQLALVVWFDKSPSSDEHHLLELFSGVRGEFAKTEHLSLLWISGSEGPPIASIDATSVRYFAEQLESKPNILAKYFKNYEVLYFDKQLLPASVLRDFKVITEPSGLMKGWYVRAHQYAKSETVGSLLAARGNASPSVGLVKIEESPDLESCRGLLHVEVNQKWVPLSPEGLQNYLYYTDQQEGRPGYFLFEGGSLYLLVKFEVKTTPEHSARVLEKLPDDRYPEVYLRAVPPPQQSAA